ncbi:GNAT family N-acetyltransferase [Demequina sp. NBRC 110052]|uniref:GNAT family N-acetyltransferase n=1 Tax=Demequina sp. NBRC 110052 TaxID=1570341 RepID=UPI0009FF33CF|nr:GNAT family N-acetyltransferase [Demequina sp. NBRC 110052]
MSEAWLPDRFVHPARAQITEAIHARPIRGDDVAIDMPAVMGNRDMLWRMYGEAWGWPPASMTAEQDREDLERHAREIEAHESFNYAVLTRDEDRLLGCIYLDPLPPDAAGPVAEVSWWLVADADAGLREALDAVVPAWLARDWPFVRVETPFQPGG